MKYSKISGADIEISQIVLGTWVFSGTNWGGSKEEDCISAVHAALDHGLTTIDTAPIYGYGLAESIVGKALKGRRGQAVIATKCGLSGRGKGIYCDLRPSVILKEIDASLMRLQTDYIDIYQCHWPDENTPIEETLNCLNSLKDSGKIRHIGVSNFQKPLLEQALEHAEIRTLQSALSMLDRELKKEILPFCRQKGIGVLSYGTLGGGILSGKYQEPRDFPKDDARSFFYKFYAGEKFPRIKEFLQKAAVLGKPLNQTALNWARQQDGVTGVIAGCRNARQVMENIEAVSWELRDDELSLIDSALQECGL